jgi:hypothetical protein
MNATSENQAQRELRKRSIRPANKQQQRIQRARLQSGSFSHQFPLHPPLL